jgi:GNAT superfamily N-acetyltransferase
VGAPKIASRKARHLLHWQNVATNFRGSQGSPRVDLNCVSIGPAAVEDCPALTNIALSAKRHWGYPEEWLQEWATLLTITPQFIGANTVFVARIARKPIGFYAITLDGQSSSLDHLWVMPQYIGQGLGQRLLKHALVQARNLGANKLLIESDPNAEGFYLHMGGKRIGEVTSTVKGNSRVIPLIEISV